MGLCVKYEMKWCLWVCWWYQALSGASAFPVTSVDPAAFRGDSWEQRYAVGSIGAGVLMIICVFSCLCCRRQRRASKGFQNSGADQSQEFKDVSGVVSDRILPRGLSTLELEVPRSTSNNRVEFEPLPVDRFVSPDSRHPGKPKPPSPSLFDREFADNEDNQIPNREWFAPDLHIPREQLKYLREIGRGWFGKVVEGTQDLNDSRSRGIVVRILTEEATASEKAWFLGEALPYLKLRHRNLLELFGTCLEADPYLLLFESCPTGDLKSFLRSNRESEVLSAEKIPLRMALDISSALGHMHSNGFAHTDLSARNCLVSPNLSIKLGDYGVGVEKYPEDYYVVGDRALPIRWSAPESLICTDTTIVTRAITPKANLWSFAILLYEIASWGERPYDSLGDEQVIEMILSLNFESYLKLDDLQSLPSLVEALRSCWKINPTDRVDLEEVIETLRGKELGNFDERWATLRPNIKEPRSSSLKELRANMDSDLWQGVPEEKPSTTPQARFRLGPDEPLKNSDLKTQISQESGSETEEESWRGRVERGAYTEKVKQKSKSIADLMVLVHIDDDSEAEWSLAPQIDKPKKKINSSGSVGDLPSVIADEFDEALRKLRDIGTNNVGNEQVTIQVTIEPIPREHMRDFSSTPKSSRAPEAPETASNNFVDVELWKNALEFELERKNTGYESINFEEIVESEKIEETLPDLMETSPSAPDTPQSRGEISVDNEDFSNGEDSTPETRRKPADPQDEEDERKHLSTPDDERSSDSGFRDKESCEEEENNVSLLFNSGISHSTTEEEQLKILYELDNILDAEYCGSYEEERPSNTLKINEDESTESLSQPTERVNGSVAGNVDSVISVDKDLVAGCVNVRAEEDSGSNLGEARDNEQEEHEGEDDDSSTMSLRSDNSYVSFNLDEEFVAAIRNELREKLPRAQLAVVESQELRDDEEPSVNKVQNTDTTSWGLNEEPESSGPGNIDIAIRYNIYGTPLSPILEERESAVTSESFASREDSREASEASRLSLSEDVIVVDTRTNKVVLVEGSNERKNPEEDRDTCGDISDDESMDIVANVGQKSQVRSRTSSGAPLPSPEEESKWQAQFPIPLQLQDDLMSTSFSTEHEWDSQDDDDEGGGEERAEVEVEDEENSSSSGEFVWKRYSEESCREDVTPTSHDVERIEEEEDEEEEEEFTPSAWDATLAPHRSALRSPEKNVKSGDITELEFSMPEWVYGACPTPSLLKDQKKNVWFKKQRYHCVYEYPKETQSSDASPSPAATTWEPTSYADWEDMMNEPRLDVYPLDYDDTNHLGEDEFFVSSGNRPFQFQAGDGKYVSQFFPGANVALAPYDDDDEITGPSDNHQVQLGELRHTRDKLKLNLPINQENNKSTAQVVQLLNESEDVEIEERERKPLAAFRSVLRSQLSDQVEKENVEIEGEEDNLESLKSISRSPELASRGKVESEEARAEGKENSSESSLSKDDQSFRSVLRSPELSERRIEDESADEVSELEVSASKTDKPSQPKSSGRPLVVATKGLIEEGIDGDIEGTGSNDEANESPVKTCHIENIIETCRVIEEPGNTNPA